MQEAACLLDSSALPHSRGKCETILERGLHWVGMHAFTPCFGPGVFPFPVIRVCTLVSWTALAESSLPRLEEDIEIKRLKGDHALGGWRASVWSMGSRQTQAGSFSEH